MSTLRAAVLGVIDAPADRVYSILADYRTGHPAILPKRYFPSLEVEEGGIGEGTQVRFQMRVLGQTREVRARIEEPESGRILVERILDERSTVTKFIVAALGDRRSQVTIITEWNSHGLQAWVERFVAPRLLRGIYEEELRNLAEYAGSRAESSTQVS